MNKVDRNVHRQRKDEVVNEFVIVDKTEGIRWGQGMENEV
jgi:hypothetical protein